jgi:integrase
MKITLYNRKHTKKTDFTSEGKLHIRLRDGRDTYLKATSNILINPNLWNEGEQKVKTRVSCSQDFRDTIDGEVEDLKSFIKEQYKTAANTELHSEWLKDVVKYYYDPRRLMQEEDERNASLAALDEADRRRRVIDCFKEYVDQQEISQVRKKNQWVIYRALQRFELFVRLTDKKRKKFTLYIDEVTPATLNEFRDYLSKEHEYRETYSEIFEQIPEKRKPEPRGHNTLVEYLTRLKAFYNWLVETVEYTNNKPFKNYKVGESIYGDPVYPTIEELHTLYSFDMSDNPELAVQRDVYVLQCCIGCRVGDYYGLTYDNIIDGAIQYVQNKKANKTLKTVTVPMNDMATEIINRYYDKERKLIMPFILEQNYNDIIKEAFKKAGLTRKVIVVDTLTTKPVIKELWETASSHMARRTLVGNLYENVKDPNIIAKISGHSENSRAFNRYRHINREMQQDLVDILSLKRGNLGQAQKAK